MNLKNWNELKNYDISRYIKQRDGFDYLPWGSCIEILHELGAEKVIFSPVVNPENGSSLFMSEQTFTDKNGNVNRCYEVRVHVEIDDLHFDVQFPLMNGSNPVKDNSMSQQRLWNAQTRAFVKGVALYTGLGFKLWLKEPESDPFESLDKHDIKKIKERVQIEYTQLLKNRLSQDDIAEKLEMTKDEVKEYFKMFNKLFDFEQRLLSIR